MPKPEGFAITGRKGFHVTFANGWTVSVQFGPGNYADNYDAPLEGRTEQDWRSSTAEVAAWPAVGAWREFDGDTVAARMTPADVLALMQEIAALPAGVTVDA